MIVRETFKVSKVGTIAGAYVTEGYIRRDSGVRVIRDGIVIYEGQLASLKRFKDDVKEVKMGYECGAMIEKFNDIKVDDVIEGFIMEEVKMTKTDKRRPIIMANYRDRRVGQEILKEVNDILRKRSVTLVENVTITDVKVTGTYSKQRSITAFYLT